MWPRPVKARVSSSHWYFCYPTSPWDEDGRNIAAWMAPTHAIQTHPVQWWPFQHTTLLLTSLVLLVSLFLFLCCYHNYWLLWKCMCYTLHYRILLVGCGDGTVGAVCCKSPLSKETEAARIFVSDCHFKHFPSGIYKIWLHTNTPSRDHSFVGKTIHQKSRNFRILFTCNADVLSSVDLWMGGLIKGFSGWYPKVFR